jgi:hypothetical protein
MGFRKGAWMSVFGVYPKTAGITQIRGCISRKNRDTGAYEMDFSGFCSCVGNETAQKALQLHPTAQHPVNIQLGDVEVKQTFKTVDGKQQVEYTNYNIYDFNLSDTVGNAAPASAPPNPAYEGLSDDVGDEGLPF